MSLTKVQPSALDTSQTYTVNQLTANTVVAGGVDLYGLANGAFAKANVPSGITYTSGTTVPVGPKLGDQWFNTFNNILFEYMSDGTSNLWIDVTSTTISSNLGYATDTVAQGIATAAYGQANTGTTLATSAFASANINAGTNLVQNTNITLAGSYANSAYGKANAAIANTGGSIAGMLNIAFTPPTATNSAIQITAANTKGGVGYADMFQLTNTSGGASNPNKFVRIGTFGTFEIVNSAYNSTLFSMTDTGDLSISGNVSIGGVKSGYSAARPGFRVYGSTNTSWGTTTNTYGHANSNQYTVDYNQGSYLNTTTGLFTAPVAGLYQINLVCRNAGNAAYSQMCVVKNVNGTYGGGTIQIMIEFGGSSTMNHTGGSTVAQLAAGDTLVLKVTAGTIQFDNNDNWSVAYLG